MEKLGAIDAARTKVSGDIEKCLATIRRLVEPQNSSLEAGLSCLNRVRAEVYEDLNQIPHEYAIIRAAEWLIANRQCPAETVWYWNARQTGPFDEPDLRGSHNGHVILSAEVTTSINPQGLIDKRMKQTLTKLSGMDGAKFYFAGSAAMCQRARTKIRKAGWSVEAIALDGMELIGEL